MDEFRKIIFSYYNEGARDLPWRKTDDPYAILVSEIMLQQTQVPRVIEKYKAWIRRFPTQRELSRATMAEILPYWTGLGYNRRALYLKQTADAIMEHYHGIFPSTPDALRKLPGVGPYTAKAICVYAYNQPHVLIETNVRTVYIHHFSPTESHVDDAAIEPLVEQTMDRTSPRKWFNALMDYGTYLKATLPNPTRKSQAYAKQKPLKGSVREVRGWIMKQLTVHQTITMEHLVSQFGNDPRITKATTGLEKDHLIAIDGDLLLLCK
jgi:A/G-specific adenine glycosylase